MPRSHFTNVFSRLHEIFALDIIVRELIINLGLFLCYLQLLCLNSET